MNTKRTIGWGLAAAVAMAFAGTTQAALVPGQSVGLDFAEGPNTPGAGAEVNFNITDRNVTIENAIDTAGNVVAGLTIQVGGTRNGADNSSAMGEANLGFGGAGVGDYTGTPFSDLSFNDGVWSSSPITVTFSGLSNNMRYNVLVLATGPANQNHEVVVTIGDLSQSQTYNTFRADNVLSPLAFDEVSTDGAGNLVIGFARAGGGSYGVAAVHITAVEVPEPASAALMSAGALLMLRRRRSR